MSEELKEIKRQFDDQLDEVLTPNQLEKLKGQAVELWCPVEETDDRK